MAAAVHAVPQVLLDPHDVAFAIHGCRCGTAPKAVAILRLQLVPEIERLVAWRELHGAGRGTAADGGRGVAVDLRRDAVNGLLVRALIHAVPQVFRRPDDIAFEVDRCRGRPTTQPVAVLVLEL